MRHRCWNGLEALLLIRGGGLRSAQASSVFFGMAFTGV